MNPLSSHTFTHIHQSAMAAGGGGPSLITDVATTALAATALTTTTEAINATVLKDPTSSDEAIAALALAALGTGIEENLSLKGVEEFYQIKNVQEKLYPRERVDYPGPKLQGSLRERPEKIFKEEVKFSDPRQKTIAMPTDKGLMLISSYYKLKYDVDIVVTGSDEKLHDALLGAGLPKSLNTWGIIATNGTMTLPHVTPIICNRLADGTIQILNLDSVLNPIDAFSEAIRDLRSEGQNIQTIRLDEERQADTYSCRTDALVVLKDALRELKHNSVTDLRAFLPIELRGKALISQLPASWGKTVQRSAALAGSDLTTRVVGKKGESVEAFQAKYKTPMTKQETYSAMYRNAEGYIDSEEIVLESTIRVNRFLNYKGKKNLDLVRHLIQANNPALASMFHTMQRFYK